MRYRHTPVRFANGRVYVWVKNATKAKKYVAGDLLNPILPGEFYLDVPSSKSIILHEPWGKPHVTHMATPTV